MSFKLITLDDLKAFTKGDFSSSFDSLIEDQLIPAVGDSFARYCNRPDFDKRQRVEYFSPGERQKCLFLSSPPLSETVTSLRNDSLKWTLSNAGAGIYYVDRTANGDPGLSQPDIVRQDYNTDLILSADATLSAGEFFYGDADTLGFNTVYVRLTDSADPDSKPLNSVVAVAYGKSSVQVYESTDRPRAYLTAVATTDYFVHEHSGVIERVGHFPKGAQTVKVVYRGGYLSSDAYGTPADLRLAATMQTKILFDRREEIALQSRSLEGGSISLFQPLTLPKSVTMILDAYRVYGGNGHAGT